MGRTCIRTRGGGEVAYNHGMPDDFADILDRMQSHHEQGLEPFLLTMGATLFQCQAFEDRLRQYMILVYEHNPQRTRAEFDRRLSESRKSDTLGGLLKKLGKLTKIGAATQALFDEFLAERNWFIHHMEYQHGTDAYDPAKLPALVQRMRDIQRRSIHLQRQIGELTIAWTVKQGMSRDEIDAATRRLLNDAVKPPPG